MIIFEKAEQKEPTKPCSAAFDASLNSSNREVSIEEVALIEEEKKAEEELPDPE